MGNSEQKSLEGEVLKSGSQKQCQTRRLCVVSIPPGCMASESNGVIIGVQC